MRNRVSRTLTAAGAAVVMLPWLAVAPARATNQESSSSIAQVRYSASAVQAFKCGSTAEVCLFRGTGYRLGEHDFAVCDDDTNFSGIIPDKFDDGVPLNDRVSSVKNMSGRALTLYEHSFGNGRARHVRAHENISDLGGFDNVASSLGWDTC